MVKFHCLMKILINGNQFMESCKSNLKTKYYKKSENLKYACLRSKIQSIKTQPYALKLHKLIKALSTPVSDINLAFLVALGLESKSENSVLQQQVLLCLVFQVLPDISRCEVPQIFNEAKLIDISVEGIPSYQTQTPSSLPYFIFVTENHSLNSS